MAAASRPGSAVPVPRRRRQAAATPPDPIPVPVLLTTKLNPPVAGRLVPRPHLVRRLAAGSSHRLTLLDAPPGWGKTTLLADWSNSAEESRRFAWLALDQADNDPVRFWNYLVEAVRTVVPEVGATALSWLRVAEIDITETAAPALLNDMAGLAEPIVLVLDDYHVITDGTVQASVRYLVDHLPPTLHLALSTRADPALPLGRLRQSGDLREMRARDLSFDVEESAALLNGVLGLGLTITDVQRLQHRTEGWAAGLCLAALSVAGLPDATTFVAAFAGDDRHVVDYLGVEVLGNQPEGVRRFLLHTCVLDRFCADLCDAVTGEPGSAALLERIEHSNLFLVPLDSSREWFRYHHLFAELLRHELAKTEPATVRTLHRRASGWYRAAGLAPEAISHALAAGDAATAAELLAGNWLDTFNQGGLATVSGWLDDLPAATVRADADLCMARAWVAMDRGQLSHAAGWIDAAEAALASSTDRADESLQLRTATLRTTHCFKTGDVRRAHAAARRAVELDPSGVFWRTVAWCLLGVTLYWLGDALGAADALTEAEAVARRESNLLATIYTLGYLAMIRVGRGELDGAERLARTALRRSDDPTRSQHFAGMMAHMALGTAQVERGQLDDAEATLARAVELSRHGAGRVEVAAALLAAADLRRRRGEPGEASRMLAEARGIVDRCADPGILGRRVVDVERRLRAAARPVGPGRPGSDQSGRGRPDAKPPGTELSDRELAVLRLLASELSQREIGHALYVSLNTVKTHARSVYRKLGTTNRAESVARARELGLI